MDFTFQSIRKGTDRGSEKDTDYLDTSHRTGGAKGLSEVKRQRRINRENDERRGGEIVTAMRQKFTTRSSINQSNHNGSSH